MTTVAVGVPGFRQRGPAGVYQPGVATLLGARQHLELVGRKQNAESNLSLKTGKSHWALYKSDSYRIGLHAKFQALFL